MSHDQPGWNRRAERRYHVLTRQAVKAVAAYAALVELGRQRKMPGDLRQRCVKRGVEARHVHGAGPALHGFAQQQERRRQVQRRQRNQRVQSFQHLGVDPHRGRESGAAVDDAVADQRRFVEAFGLDVGQRCVERGAGCGHGRCEQLGLDLGVAQLVHAVFQRRRTGVERQYRFGHVSDLGQRKSRISGKSSKQARTYSPCLTSAARHSRDNSSLSSASSTECLSASSTK